MNENDQISGKIQQLLSNPDSLKSILEIASSIGGQKKNDITANESEIQQSTEESTTAISEIASKIPAIPYSTDRDERVDLLLSIKPFLGDRKRQRVDSLVKALNAAKIINAYKNTDLFSVFGLK